MRRQMELRAAVGAMAALAVIAQPLGARATVVRFDNPLGPGHYQWAPPPGIGTHWIDVTMAANAQPGLVNGVTSFQQTNVGGTASKIFASPSTTQMQYGGIHSALVWGTAEGDAIPAAIPPANYNWNRTNYILHPSIGSNLTAGEATYLGLRFDLGSGFQYGWIGVVRTGIALDAFAWAYETEPGVPIVAGAPEPGTLAACSLGAVSILHRRRRVAI